ncbi:unnamed protein product [Blepharisma stoltei]|uniref:FYVE-type domain-containing protein n=1 Tax=Blepharisma stoltei TaxID=1481888 RepID=A0AAU9JUK5_9CILI|nr:unnamed protein product [Blepharisma stoltei]
MERQHTEPGLKAHHHSIITRRRSNYYTITPYVDKLAYKDDKSCVVCGNFFNLLRKRYCCTVCYRGCCLKCITEPPSIPGIKFRLRICNNCTNNSIQSSVRKNFKTSLKNVNKELKGLEKNIDQYKRQSITENIKIEQLQIKIAEAQETKNRQNIEYLGLIDTLKKDNQKLEGEIAEFKARAKELTVENKGKKRKIKKIKHELLFYENNLDAKNEKLKSVLHGIVEENEEIDKKIKDLGSRSEPDSFEKWSNEAELEIIIDCMKKQLEGDKAHIEAIQNLHTEMGEKIEKKDKEILNLTQNIFLFTQKDEKRTSQNTTMTSTITEDRFSFLNSKIAKQKRAIKTLEATIIDLKSPEELIRRDSIKNDVCNCNII